jgi:CubicO group peptidase (beta-lactamase class C family)
MHIERLFEEGMKEGLFTDYDVCVEGPTRTQTSGGAHISAGARLFDTASLTKACTHLLCLKLFTERKLRPEDSFTRYLNVPQTNGDDRRLWHFLCYIVQSYAFDYESLRDGTTKPFKEELLSKGFGHWSRRFKYDNLASAYLAILLEEIFKSDLETIFRNELLESGEQERFLFHPVRRGLIDPSLVVPTKAEPETRGRVHDPLSLQHEDTVLSVAGLFSDAQTMTGIFHRQIDSIIAGGLYDEVSRNQLPKMGLAGNSYSLGFDIPYSESLKGLSVDGPLVFAGWTGCRLFFAKKPRITVCFLTNRVYCQGTEEARKRFTEFSWSVIREALRRAQ